MLLYLFEIYNIKLKNNGKTKNISEIFYNVVFALIVFILTRTWSAGPDWSTFPSPSPRRTRRKLPAFTFNIKFFGIVLRNCNIFMRLRLRIKILPPLWLLYLLTAFSKTKMLKTYWRRYTS
jgi:hypothetical protein